jgi:hypothetical protein
MEPTLVYLFGAPASGKSTLMAELTKACERSPVPGSVPHELLFREGRPVGVELGKRRDSFSGTDALSLSIHPKAVSWVGTRPYVLILGEGARLATAGFLGAAEAAGYRVFPVYLDASEEVLAERRAQRGSQQDASWAKGAGTRALNLAQRLGAMGISTEFPAEEVAARVRDRIPALGVLA